MCHSLSATFRGSVGNTLASHLGLAPSLCTCINLCYLKEFIIPQAFWSKGDSLEKKTKGLVVPPKVIQYQYITQETKGLVKV